MPIDVKLPASVLWDLDGLYIDGSLTAVAMGEPRDVAAFPDFLLLATNVSQSDILGQSDAATQPGQVGSIPEFWGPLLMLFALVMVSPLMRSSTTK